MIDSRFEKFASWFLRWPSLIAFSAISGAVIVLDHNIKDQKSQPVPNKYEYRTPTTADTKLDSPIDGRKIEKPGEAYFIKDIDIAMNPFAANKPQNCRKNGQLFAKQLERRDLWNSHLTSLWLTCVTPKQSKKGIQTINMLCTRSKDKISCVDTLKMTL
jgi:hypothetical protein